MSKVVRANKEPVEDEVRVINNYQRKPILQQKILNYIRDHPNCTRADIYKLDPNEGSCRKTILVLQKQRKIKECFIINKPD